MTPNYEYRHNDWPEGRWEPIYVEGDSFYRGNGDKWHKNNTSFSNLCDSAYVRALKDNVNSPSHYGQGSIEAIEYIKDFLTHEEYIGYLRGNVAKYLHRWRYKNGLEDLKKAEVYLKWMIESVSEEKTDD